MGMAEDNDMAGGPPALALDGARTRLPSKLDAKRGLAFEAAQVVEAGNRPNLMNAAMQGATQALRNGDVREGGLTKSSEDEPDPEVWDTATTPGAYPGGPVIERSGTVLSSKSVQSAGALLRRRIEAFAHDLERVTGEDGDVEREQTAYGEANLTFKDVEFTVRLKDGSERQILAPCSGHFESGSLVALMGPSGCGKTTLLDILAGKKTSPWKGTVHLNGRPRDKLFNRLTSYIPQDDIMPAHLTVLEMVTFYTRLKARRPGGISHASCRYFIEQRLKLLGLYDARDTRIGNETVRGISGGQRRRLSLACGLSTMAQIFFADEPTSGLSGTDAEACIRYMRLMAKKMGLTLIVAIHQPRPEVACLFDHLMLLTANPGQVVYNGPMREAAQVWESVGYPVPEFVNPTDHFLDLVTPGTRVGRPDLFVEYYEQHQQPQVDRLVEQELNRPLKTTFELLENGRLVMQAYGEVPPVTNSVYGVGFSSQLRFVFVRQLRLSLRDPLGISMELAVAIGQSVVIGATYLHVGKKEAMHQMLFYFMLSMTVALVGMKVMPKLVDERLVVKKETSEALYSDWAYIISLSAINTVVGIVGNTIFVVLVFWMSSCDWEMFPVVFGWTTLLYVVMDSVYTMIAAIAKDSATAMTLALPFLTLFLLYNNFTVYADLLPGFMRWLIRLSPVAYTIEQIAVEAVRLEPKNFGPIAEQVGYTDKTGSALTVMIVCWVVFRGLAVIFFKMLNNIRR